MKIKIIQKELFRWKVLNKECRNQGITPAELLIKAGIVENNITQFDLLSVLGLVGYTFILSIRIGELRGIQPMPIAELNKVDFKNPKHKTSIQNFSSNGDGIIITDINGDSSYFLPMPTNLFLNQLLPQYLKAISQKGPKVRLQLAEAKKEIGDYLEKKHALGEISESWFLNWFFKEVDQTIIKSYGEFVTSKENITYSNWSFDLHEFTPEIIHKHLDDYYRYSQEELNKLPSTNKINGKNTEDYVDSKEIEKNINITKEGIEKIKAVLLPHFEDSDAILLGRLLEGKTIDKKLNFLKNANQLTDVFWRASKGRGGYILDTNKTICEWILTNFSYNNGKEFEKTSTASDINTAATRCKRPLRNAKSIFTE